MYWISVKVVAWCRQYPLVGSFLVPLLQNITIEWRNWTAMTSTCCWLCYHFQATCWAWRTGREFVDGAELDWAGGVRDAARAAQVFGFSGTAIKPQDKKKKKNHIQCYECLHRIIDKKIKMFLLNYHMQSIRNFTDHFQSYTTTPPPTKKKDNKNRQLISLTVSTW